MHFYLVGISTTVQVKMEHDNYAVSYCCCLASVGLKCVLESRIGFRKLTIAAMFVKKIFKLLVP